MVVDVVFDEERDHVERSTLSFISFLNVFTQNSIKTVEANEDGDTLHCSTINTIKLLFKTVTLRTTVIYLFIYIV